MEIHTLYSGSNDKTIKMWNIQENNEIGVLGKNDYPVFNLCLSKDGNTIFLVVLRQ